MELIRVLDHVEHTSSYEDGNVIYELIAPRVREGEDVTLSFEGVSAVPSSFVNASIVRLAEIIPLAEIRKHLSLTNTTRQINEMVKMRFQYLAKAEKEWGNDDDLLLKQFERILAEQPAWTGVLTDPIRRQIEEGVHPGLYAGSFAGWERRLQAMAREFRKRHNLPEPPEISLHTKMQVIREAGMEVPEFPCRSVPEGFDIGDAPRAKHGSQYAPSLHEYWLSRVDEVYRQALSPKKADGAGQAPSA